MSAVTTGLATAGA